LRPGQRQLAETLLPRLAISLPQRGRLDPTALFSAPVSAVWLEIGFGGGEHLAEQAAGHPDIGFIGCEVFENGVARLLGEIDRRGLCNIRLFTDDARLVMAALPDRSLSRAFILFPDPWPKTRHHKRRFVGRTNLDVLARLMKPGAELRLATDDPSYLPWMVEHACTHPAFEWLAERPSDWRGRPDDWPPTRYEQKMLAGHKPVFFRLRRV
jgi:tRNA (guanine-N7-)-methyltransferase